MLVPTVAHALRHSAGVRAIFDRDPEMIPPEPELLLDGRLAIVGGAYLPSGIGFPRSAPDPERPLAVLVVDDGLDLSAEGSAAAVLAGFPERADLRVVIAAGAAREPDEASGAVAALRGVDAVPVVGEHEIRRSVAAGLAPPLDGFDPDPSLEGLPSPGTVAELHTAACAGLHGEVAALLADGADPSHPVVEGGVGPAVSAALALRRIMVHGTGPVTPGGRPGSSERLARSPRRAALPR